MPQACDCDRRGSLLDRRLRRGTTLDECRRGGGLWRWEPDQARMDHGGIPPGLATPSLLLHRLEPPARCAAPEPFRTGALADDSDTFATFGISNLVVACCAYA